MDEETIQSTLGTLKEMVLDEQKLVTYLSLSKELCIHVNESKILLAKLIEDLSKKQLDVKLNVSYIISGLCGDHKARTTVSSHEDIDALRKSFKIIFYEHVYSVSKGISTVDKVAFMAVNRFEDFPLCTGLIRSEVCTKHTMDEIGNLKSNSQQSVSDDKPTQGPSKKVKLEKKETEVHIINGHSETKTVSKIQESKSEPNVKTEKTSPKKDSGSNNKQTSTAKKTNGKTQKGIAGFFSKSNSAPSKKIEQVMEKQEPIIKEEKKAIEKPKPEKIEVMEVDEEPVKKNVETKKQRNGKAKDNSLTEIKKTAKLDKKRKRVLHVSDSESDGEKNDPFEDEPEVKIDDGSEDEIPPTPTIATVKITSGIINPKKRRKIVDKTYTDEDGFILTRKEEVYESCSDHEEVKEEIKENIQKPKINQTKQEISPPEKKINTKSKKKSPKKGAQSIMNFFKKV